MTRTVSFDGFRIDSAFFLQCIAGLLYLFNLDLLNLDLLNLELFQFVIFPTKKYQW